MRRVTGIGGIFMSARNPKALCDWYKKHLGIDVQPWGGAAFEWTDSEGNPTKGTTACSQSTARGRLQRDREDRRLGVREIRLGHGSRG